jgi:hypothetical protein
LLLQRAPCQALTLLLPTQPLLATEGDNSANILVPDLVSCNGLLHIVDAVLVPPTLTTLQQISFRPELSLFKRLILSPGLEAVRRSLNIEVIVVGGLFLRTASIAVWAPTDAALLTALAYLGMTPDDILVPLIDPLVALAVRTQLVVYHLTADGLQRGVGRALRTDVLRTPLLAQGDLLPSLLLSPILQKRPPWAQAQACRPQGHCTALPALPWDGARVMHGDCLAAKRHRAAHRRSKAR